MDFEVILDSLPLYGHGALVTLALLVLSLAIGLALALPLAMLRSLPSPWAWRPVWLFTYVMRGTPLVTVMKVLIAVPFCAFGFSATPILRPCLLLSVSPISRIIDNAPLPLV